LSLQGLQVGTKTATTTHCASAATWEFVNFLQSGQMLVALCRECLQESNFSCFETLGSHLLSVKSSLHYSYTSVNKTPQNWSRNFVLNEVLLWR